MALSGAIMVGFLIAHMAGNLKIFAPPGMLGSYKIDHYARFLRTVGSDLLGEQTVLWIARIVLLLAVTLHVLMAVQLRLRNRAARPVPYQKVRHRASNIASRGMFFGGLIVLVFIVAHILHFTTGTIHMRGFMEGHVYANVYSAFSVWYIALAYVVAMTAVAFHLYHGVWSMFQTLGIDGPDTNCALRFAARVLALALFVGFISVPVAIWCGLLSPPVILMAG